MALRNQPYIPLYVQDYLTDEKLNECSASSQGIYIKIMCLLHKSSEYGMILLKQKDKQTTNQIKNLAFKFVKHLPFSVEEMEIALTELIEENVLQLDCEKGILSQKRMIKDNKLSIKRSNAGSKGGKKTQFAKANTKAKRQANTESEYENEYENEFVINNKEKNKEKNKEIMIMWNYFANNYGLSKIKSLAKKRIAKLNIRAKESNFVLEDILRIAEKSKFLMGDNKSGWKITFDWLIENENNYIKILEGNYNNGTHKQSDTVITESELRKHAESIADDDRYK